MLLKELARIKLVNQTEAFQAVMMLFRHWFQIIPCKIVFIIILIYDVQLKCYMAFMHFVYAIPVLYILCLVYVLHNIYARYSKLRQCLECSNEQCVHFSGSSFNLYIYVVV
jgi:hypothetical protein